MSDISDKVSTVAGSSVDTDGRRTEGSRKLDLSSLLKPRLRKRDLFREYLTEEQFRDRYGPYCALFNYSELPPVCLLSDEKQIFRTVFSKRRQLLICVPKR